MHFLIPIFAICCLSAQAKPSHPHTHQQLEGVPDLESFNHISYPKFNLIDLGSYSKGDIPPKEIVITKHITVTQSKPYPVKVPHPVPYPVPHNVPYPVVETKIVEVPHPVPYEVTKNVHVPVEILKPYPVSHQEYQPSSNGGNYGSGIQELGHDIQQQAHLESGGDHSSFSSTYGVPGQSPGVPHGVEQHDQNYQSEYQSYNQEYENNHGQADQSANYGALIHVPVPGESFSNKGQGQPDQQQIHPVQEKSEER